MKMKLLLSTALFSLICLLFIDSIVVADEKTKQPKQPKQPEILKGSAPPDYKMLKRTLGGAYFVKKSFKEKYDQIKSQLKELKKEIAAGKISSWQATRRLKKLKEELIVINKLMEDDKILVSPAKVFQQTETTEFKLSKEKFLVINADGITLKGWDGETVKCVLEKKILTDGKAPAKEEFQSVQVIHKQGIFPGYVGQTKEWTDNKIFEVENDKKLTDEFKEIRVKWLRSSRERYQEFEKFQGREIDRIKVFGLAHRQGNRHIFYEATSPTGGGIAGGSWIRHASLTVYVPKCQKIILGGYRTRLKVENVNSDLIISESGGQGNEGVFLIKDLEGNLRVKNALLHSVENVNGNVLIENTISRSLGGSSQPWHTKIMSSGSSVETSFKNIKGDLKLWFQKADLKIESVTGQIDVLNEFGNTELIFEKNLADKAHRIISLSGSIRTRIRKPKEFSLPVIAATSSGSVRSNLFNSHINDFMVFNEDSSDGTRRYWQGLRSEKTNEHKTMDYSRILRINKAFNNLERSPGLDLISRNGLVIVDK